MTETDGTAYQFSAIDPNTHAAVWTETIAPGGESTMATYTSGRLREIDYRMTPSLSGTVYKELDYTYVSGVYNTGQVESITLKGWNSGTSQLQNVFQNVLHLLRHRRYQRLGGRFADCHHGAMGPQPWRFWRF